jgi:hypothetical protein
MYNQRENYNLKSTFSRGSIFLSMSQSILRLNDVKLYCKAFPHWWQSGFPFHQIVINNVFSYNEIHYI